MVRARIRLATLEQAIEYQAGCRQQDPKHRLGLGGDLVAPNVGLDAEVRLHRVRLGMLFNHRGVGDPELRPRLFQSRARGQPAEQLRHAVDAPGDHGGREVVRAGDDVGDDLGLCGIRDGRLQHPDDGRDPRAQLDDLSEHRGVAMQRGRPKVVRQDHGAGGGWTVVPHVEQPPHHRM